MVPPAAAAAPVCASFVAASPEFGFAVVRGVYSAKNSILRSFLMVFLVFWLGPPGLSQMRVKWMRFWVVVFWSQFLIKSPVTFFHQNLDAFLSQNVDAIFLHFLDAILDQNRGAIWVHFWVAFWLPILDAFLDQLATKIFANWAPSWRAIRFAWICVPVQKQ